MSVVSDFVEYCNADRMHLSLEKDAPDCRPAQTRGKVIGTLVLGGDHVYRRGT